MEQKLPLTPAMTDYGQSPVFRKGMGSATSLVIFALVLCFAAPAFISYTIDQVVELNEVHEHLAFQPELIHIGSDGGGEAIAFDFRQVPPTVIRVNLASTDWSEAILQAASFAEFMDQ